MSFKRFNRLDGRGLIRVELQEVDLNNSFIVVLKESIDEILRQIEVRGTISTEEVKEIVISQLRYPNGQILTIDNTHYSIGDLLYRFYNSHFNVEIGQRYSGNEFCEILESKKIDTVWEFIEELNQETDNENKYYDDEISFVSREEVESNVEVAYEYLYTYGTSEQYEKEELDQDLIRRFKCKVQDEVFGIDASQSYRIFPEYCSCIYDRIKNIRNQLNEIITKYIDSVWLGDEFSKERKIEQFKSDLSEILV